MKKIKIDKNYLKKLNPMKFFSIVQERIKRFKKGAITPLPLEYPVNTLARKLHPSKQHVFISKIEEHIQGCKTFTFEADKENGTEELAYFSAGQYITIFLDINGLKITRAYSLSSAPCSSISNRSGKIGFYQITVKAVNGGLVSTYILENWKVGSKVTISAPEGNFDYNYLRDAPTVVGIAGGSGITPFLSMAKSIAAGDEDFNLILLYGNRDKKSILFKEDFDRLSHETQKIKVVYVLSNEEESASEESKNQDSTDVQIHSTKADCQYEYGFITAELVKKYTSHLAKNSKDNLSELSENTLTNNKVAGSECPPSENPYSIFLCGPQSMYNFMDGELKKLNIEKKYIRHEMFGEIHSAKSQEGYPGFPQQETEENLSEKEPADTIEKQTTYTKGPASTEKPDNLEQTVSACPEVTITVHICDQTFTVKGNADDTILQILEKGGVAVPNRCRSGECGWCHSYLKSGKVFVPQKLDYRRKADLKYGFIHPCCTFALSNLELDIPPAK